MHSQNVTITLNYQYQPVGPTIYQRLQYHYKETQWQFLYSQAFVLVLTTFCIYMLVLLFILCGNMNNQTSHRRKQQKKLTAKKINLTVTIFRWIYVFQFINHLKNIKTSEAHCSIITERQPCWRAVQEAHVELLWMKKTAWKCCLEFKLTAFKRDFVSVFTDIKIKVTDYKKS